MGPFEVSAELVGRLSDTELRSLLRLLLEAEMRKRGIAASAVAVGGHQSTADSGVDASVTWSGLPRPQGWLARQTTYFQCKAQVMAPAKIREEMRPDGRARPIFDELAKARGSYVVFSSDDVAHAGQQRRLDTIRESLADVKGGDQIHVDFLGADRVARWTNQHLGVAVWLLGMVGRGLGGWRPAGDWSAPGASGLPYLFDDSRRAVLRDQSTDIRSAIAEMRRILSEPGGTIRLVGLSGMGKTRLAEALFDPKVVAGACLPAERAIYGDAGLDLSISAALLGEQLVLAEVTSVIVVDNCPAKIHEQVAEIVTRKSSRASLLTIDYDIESDAIAGELVRLEGNSEALISQLLTQRRPSLTRSERNHLAEFSGGNARIALKIAEGAEGGDLSKLRDGELLDRLFRSGRRDEEPGLRRSAELASLVYAFYVEDADRYQAEDWALARLDGVSTATFYRHIATLLDWGVVQQRGPQRAVMPPPLANMLAAPFIRRSEPTRLLQAFVDGPPRLLASFARRLGELHSEPAAQRIAQVLLTKRGALSEVAKLDGPGLRGFAHLAPAAPQATLVAIERMIEGANGTERLRIGTNHRLECARLLRKLSFDEELFGRAVVALVELYLGTDQGDEKTKVRGELDLIFRPFGAPTRANQAARLAAVDRMLADVRPAARDCGMAALGSMVNPFEAACEDQRFGNRSLGERWQPADQASHYGWFEAAYDRIGSAAIADRGLVVAARAIVAEALSSHLDLPTKKLAISAVRAAKPPGYWQEGWRRAAPLTLYAAGADLEASRDVAELATELRPTTPEDLFDTFVCSVRDWELGVLWRQLSEEKSAAAELGRRFAQEEIAVARFMVRSDAADPGNALGEFGSSFGRHTHCPVALWKDATTAFAAGTRSARQVQLLAGVLSGIAMENRETVEGWLDVAVTDPVLSEHLIALQVALGLDRRAVRRVIEAISLRQLQPDQVSQLITYKNVALIPHDSLGDFVKLIYRDNGGVYPAIALLCNYFYELPESSIASPDLVQLGRDFLENPRTYAEDVGGLTGTVGALAHDILSRTRGPERVAAICEAIIRSRPTSTFVGASFQSLGSLLTKHFPEIVMDNILATQTRDDIIRVFFSGSEAVPAETALRWLQQDPQARCLLLAKIAPMLEGSKRAGQRQWSRLALETIAAAVRPAQVLRIFEQRVFSGSGSLMARLLDFQSLVTVLAGHSDERVRHWAASADKRVKRHIARWDKSERANHARFE